MIPPSPKSLTPIALLWLPATTHASLTFLNSQLRNKISQTIPGGRAIQSVSYGCWCFFEEMPVMTGNKKPFKPKGKPVDKLDGYCKELTEAYECIARDSPLDKNGNECNPRYTDSGLSETWWIDINYNMWGGPMSDGDLKDNCLALHGGVDSCEVFACMVEAQFLMRFWDKTENFLNDEDFGKYGKAWDTYGENVDYEGNFYDYDQHTFDPETNCLTSGTGGQERECCGAYPNRFFYRPKDGQVGCCNGGTYNTMFHECCLGEDGGNYLGDFGCAK